MKTASRILQFLLYEGQSKSNEPKSLLGVFIAIKSKVIHQKKAQGQEISVLLFNVISALFNSNCPSMNKGHYASLVKFSRLHFQTSFLLRSCSFLTAFLLYSFCVRLRYIVMNPGLISCHYTAEKSFATFVTLNELRTSFKTGLLVKIQKFPRNPTGTNLCKA